MAAVAPHTAWRASLDLEFTRRGDATILSRNRHEGPLQVQKALYPEGRDTCHVVVLHPPGGVVAGDQLRVHATCAPGARALLTTPGAAKWYRSEGSQAAQRIRLTLAADATLEWLPRESILFDGSRVAMHLEVELEAGAKYVGWDILSFGRRASGERWRRGVLRMHTRLRCAGRLIWSENADIDAANGFAESPVGLRGFSVCGTCVIAGGELSDALLKRCREARPARPAAHVGITRLPLLWVARYLGDSSQEAFAWFTDLWAIVRPELSGRAACVPRVWAC